MRTWEHIYENNSAKLKGVCRRYVNSDEVAEDIMHDAFEIAMQKADSYSGKGSFDGWLYKITVNTALQYLRNNKKTVNKTDDLLDYHYNNGQEDEYSQNKKSQVHQANFEVSDLLNAIDLLPEHHRTVFNLYVLEKHSHKEISEKLEITVNTSKSHLNRARKKLQSTLLEEAKNKEKNNIKKYLLLLFPFWFSIDGLYANSFKGYRLATKFKRVEFSKISISESKSFSFFNKLTSLFIVVSAVGCLLFFLNKSEKNQSYDKLEIKKESETLTLNIEDYVKEIDSLLNSRNLKKQTEITSQIEKFSKKQVLIQVPVVVHKQVIINDTILKQ